MTDNTENPMQTVARMAAGFKKPNKKNAFNDLDALINTLAIECPHLMRDNVTLGQLADLYAFFLPPAPAKPKTAWDWVAKAMGTSDVRYYLNWVYVTADHITATDGHRLHRAPNTDNRAPGYYDKAGNLCHGPDYATYPDVERIIPRNLDSSRALDINDPTPAAPEKSMHPTDYPVADGATARFHMPYIKEAVSMETPKWVGVNEAGCARFDFDGECLAVVMGMRK